MYYRNKYYYYILGAHLNEKYNQNTFMRLEIKNYFFNEMKISYTLNSNQKNISLLLINQIILERIFLQKPTLIESKTQNPNFSLNKGDKFGGHITINNDMKILNWLFFNINLSFNKVNNDFFLVKQSIKKNNIEALNFGFNKLLFYFILSSYTDWNLFSYIYDEKIYGTYLQFSNRILLINHYKMILSHLGILIK